MTMTFGPTAIATPANLLTLGRLFVSPFLLWLILDSGHSWPAFALWVLLTATDGLDGWLARRHGTTRSGAFLDPLADKVLVLGALFALVAEGQFWWFPVALIFAREISMSVYRLVLAQHGVSIPARRSAKAKTLVQELAVGFALLPLTALDHRWVGVGLLWVAVALALVSGIQYLVEGRRMIPATRG